MNRFFAFHTGFRSLSLCVLLWTTAQAAMSQTDHVERRYQYAVRFIQQKDYVKAKAELRPLTEIRTSGIAPYAHYYHALADFNLKRFSESRLMLKQLIDRFPDWKKMDDAYYLLGAAFFENGQYEEGIENLSRIGDPALKPDVSKLQTYYFSQINDLNRLKLMQKEFPNNRELALALIDQIQRTSTAPADLELSDRLTNRFGVPGVSRPVTTEASSSTATVARPEKNRNKGYYNVAVLFPFRLNDINPEERARSNQYALDLYNGMRLAKTKLQSEGITVNLFAYDVDNDGTKMTTLVNNPGFIQNDLLIGPLYAEPNRIATEFANQNNVLLVNPISTSSELVVNQPLAFLANASLNQQALKTVAFARTLSMVKKAAIYYGNTRKDSTLAALYQNELKRIGYTVQDFRKVGSSDLEAIRLSETNKPGHIFLVSSDESTGAKLLRLLTQRKVEVPVIATSSAFNFDKDPLSTFSKSDLYLVYPEFVDPERPGSDEFEELYLDQRNMIPSMYAYQGYDMLLFFGRMLARTRGQITNRSQLKATPEEGYLLSGYDYTASNDNQVVPIVKYDGTRFTLIK
ncbi:ABC transporter substrate-binding protein [Larkinella punicea]|uniref:Amino acid ABC transporter substrate-binding protein n=1 Tax=Larkinella punicea TaxID=2315727 RepID=A0A368JT03_9BACT|nr:ABC transporter substrate-binding protein [Larkinella punicea]RCR70800.1 amino acid ABC transporter substrate-binding protein [Larkinella punicea]